MRLKRSTLFVDVLSVKEFPKRLLLAQLPPEVRAARAAQGAANWADGRWRWACRAAGRGVQLAVLACLAHFMHLFATFPLPNV